MRCGDLHDSAHAGSEGPHRRRTRASEEGQFEHDHILPPTSLGGLVATKAPTRDRTKGSPRVVRSRDLLLERTDMAQCASVFHRDPMCRDVKSAPELGR